MIRKCVECRVNIDVKSIRTKYCQICKVIINKKKKSEWDKKFRRKIAYDMFCLDCNESLPINSRSDKLYCEICAKKRYNKQHNDYLKNRYKTEKLDKFYKNIRINLIQSPYLIDRRKIELTV